MWRCMVCSPAVVAGADGGGQRRVKTDGAYGSAYRIPHTAGGLARPGWVCSAASLARSLVLTRYRSGIIIGVNHIIS